MTPSSKSDKAFATIPAQDIDDVVGIAARMMEEDADQMPRDEVVAVGQDLDIPEEVLDRAWKELVRQRAATAHAKATRTKHILIALAAIAALLLALGALTALKSHSLHDSYRQVDSARAKVDSVRQLQQEILAQWGPQGDSPDKMAALDGARNRVRVESARYGDSALRYNAQADGVLSRLARHFSSLPPSVPTTLP